MSDASDFHVNDWELTDCIEIETGGMEDMVNDKISEAYEAGLEQGKEEASEGEDLKELRRLHQRLKQLKEEAEGVKQAMRILLEASDA
jgi:hypothetical protein